MSHGTSPSSFSEIDALYRRLLAAWNEREASGMAALFHPEGHVVGFDGSEMTGPAEIESALKPIFAGHPTGAYVAKIREVRALDAEGNVVLLRAIAGMVPAGKAEVNPALHAVQTLLATRRLGRWQIQLFQNTPAAYHGRPELTQELTRELTEVLRAR